MTFPNVQFAPPPARFVAATAIICQHLQANGIDGIYIHNAEETRQLWGEFSHDELFADSARYRYIRNTNLVRDDNLTDGVVDTLMVMTPEGPEPIDPDEMDELIDGAITREIAAMESAAMASDDGAERCTCKDCATADRFEELESTVATMMKSFNVMTATLELMAGRRSVPA